MFCNNKEDSNIYRRNEEDYQGPRSGKKPMPITPRILIKALKSLKKKTFKGLFFTPKDVAREILEKFPCVEQDFPILLLEVTDKLVCAAAASLIGSNYDLGFYAFDFRQSGHRSHSRSELMFWVFYKRVLQEKMEQERRRVRNKRAETPNKIIKRKDKVSDKKMPKSFKRDKIYRVLSLY